MGCDIHIYPEYWCEDDLDFEKKIYTHSLCQNYDIGRSYNLFAIMAGVRGSGNNTVTQPRGVPDSPGLGFWAEHDLTLTIVPDNEMKQENCWDGKYVSESIANTWKDGTGLMFGRGIKLYKTIDMQDGSKREVIFNPDYHSLSWLTLPELFEVRKRYLMEQIEYSYEEYEMKKKDTKPYKKILKDVKDPQLLMNHSFGVFEYASLNGLIGMLYFIERTNPKIKTRITFWFDS